ncbi:hypothetical protein AAU61_14445 [Desulfocarbo indianensis]|nr:hypothetical protein AAU61_14445 [Desulfocarbo indianensis]
MKAAAKQRRVKVFNFVPAGGVCTTHEPWLLPKNKLAEGWNIMLTASLGERGIIVDARSRPGTRRLTSRALPNGEAVRFHLRYAGTDYLASDANLYRLDAGRAPALIGPVNQAPFLAGYRGLVVALDGGLAKRVDPENAYSYGILHDVDGFLWDWLGDENAGAWRLHAGGTTRAGLKATTPAWGLGTIPVDRATAYLSKEGAPTGEYFFKAFAADGITLLGSKSFDAAELPGEPLQVTAELEPQGAGLEAGPGAARYFVVEYAAGDASNHVKLHYAQATGGAAATYAASAWSLDGAKNPLMRVGAGLPPDKCLVAGRKAERLVIGTGDGKAHYCDNNDPFSWGASAYNGGSAGWIGVGRHDGGAVNAMAAMFDDLVISKSGDQAIYRLTGSLPGADGDWALPRISEHEGALAGKTMQSVGDNILYLDEEVLGIEGVESFGDVRRFPKSRDVANLIQAHRGPEAFAVYNRAHDQYWLHMPGLDCTLVYHILPQAWTMYRWAGLEPTCFSHFDGETFIGSGGHLFVLDDAVQGRDGYVDEQDAGQGFTAEAWGPMLDLGAPHNHKEFKALAFQVSARLGASLEVMFKTDFGKVCRSELTRRFLIPLDDDVRVGDFEGTTFTVGDALFPVGGSGNRLASHALAFLASTNCQCGIRLDPGGAPARLGPVTLTFAVL